MNETSRPTSWWQTLPGILTALAAAITALSGFVALLFQHGVLGHRKSEPPTEVAAAQTIPRVETTPAAAKDSPPASAPQISRAKRPWSDAEAVLLSREGKVTRVRADSFSNCISADHELSLDGNQAIPFEKMASFDVLQADDNFTPNAKAKLKVTLLDGTELSGKVAADCDLFGYNSLGRFTTFFHRLQSVRFE